ncbi:MAG: class I SAM-dependent methyltransferase, partial [Magnetococcus sp. WYHC-3]
MIPEPYLSLLRCPACRGPLRPAGDTAHPRLDCVLCAHPYPVVDGIPVLLRGATWESLEQRFQRYWDPPEKADLYDRKVEGDDPFGVYNHRSEIQGLTLLYRPENLDWVLDAGCGNGRFFATLPAECQSVGADASLNLLRITRARGRGRFHVCCELEHLPFASGRFGTVLSCRVLQHLREQRAAVTEMARLVRPGGDLILELYNSLNLKTLYKNLRMSPWQKVANAPFRLLFRSLSPFPPWGLDYDAYNHWWQVRGWMTAAGLAGFRGRGVGFGFHKYLFQPFFIDAQWRRRHPSSLVRWYAACESLERRIGHWPLFRHGMEKFTLAGSRISTPPGVLARSSLGQTLVHVWQESPWCQARARAEMRREVQGERGTHAAHAHATLAWIKRAQDACGGDGVSRGYALGYSRHFRARGWQPAYPETTGYLIPTCLEAARRMGDSDARRRAWRMAHWEVSVQLPGGAVQGGTLPGPRQVPRPVTPAVFNTGQVILGWLAAHQEFGDAAFLASATRAGRWLVAQQDGDGHWCRGNSLYARGELTTYNARVGWALILLGQACGEDDFVRAGSANIQAVLARQLENGWFTHNCLSDPARPLLHTLCYAVEGVWGAAQALGRQDWQARATLSARALRDAVDGAGRIGGRLDSGWQRVVPWDCLTGSAQLASILLRLYQAGGVSRDREVAGRPLEPRLTLSRKRLTPVRPGGIVAARAIQQQGIQEELGR